MPDAILQVKMNGADPICWQLFVVRQIKNTHPRKLIDGEVLLPKTYSKLDRRPYDNGNIVTAINKEVRIVRLLADKSALWHESIYAPG